MICLGNGNGIAILILEIFKASYFTSNYGVYSIDSYGIETKRYAKAEIFPSIIDLSDNSLLYRSGAFGMERIHGKWNTPPNYENLKSWIIKTINEATEREKLNY